MHKSGTGCARVWDGLKITKKKIRKENYKRLPRSIEPSRFQNILATESHKTLFSHASNTELEFSSFFSHIVILIAVPVCYSRWHKRCSRDRLKMQMTHFFFHDHDATQSECAHRLLRTNNYLSPESQGRGRGPRIWGGGEHMVFRDHEGKGRISRLYQSF